MQPQPPPPSSQPRTKTISAPTSPMKDKRTASFLGKVSSFSAVVSQKVEQAKDAAGHIRVPGINKEKCFTLLVVDDPTTDWSKYFRGRRILGGEYDIRVEQAEFKELTVTASTEAGVTTSIIMYKTGNKVVRSFKPDFLLVRQNLRDGNEDYRNLLLGFQYGDVPSVNSLDSIYNFQDKPWVFAQMLKVQRKLGKENFPIIEQSYYPNHREMLSSNRYPCVFKIGHAHGGMGKVKVENNTCFQDITSLIGVMDNYCTVENYVDAKYDLHVQKIGSNYKALMRKSLCGNWKTNIGQSILEEVAVTDRYKAWIDAVSEMFGGLDICSLEAIVGKDGKEFIIEVNDSATTLMGESQEDDRRHIAEIVLKAMEEKCKAPPPTAAEKTSTAAPATTATTAATTATAGQSLNNVSRTVSKGSVTTSTPPAAASSAQTTSTPKVKAEPQARRRHDSQASESSTVSGVSSASSNMKKGKPEDDEIKTNEAGEVVVPPEGEDTMKNLRKTFAGIFGDLS